MALGLCGCEANAIGVLEPPPGEPTQVETQEPVDAAAPPASDELVLDDFVDLDEYPLSAAFGVWHVYTYNAGAQFMEFSIDAAAHDGGAALRFDFEIRDPKDGVPNYGMVGLDTMARVADNDLSEFSGVRLSHRLEPRLADCELPSAFNFGFYCADYIANYEISLDLTPSWITDAVAFSSFHEITYRPPTGIPVSECLAKATALYFEVQPELDDGECGAGTLWLDSIVLLRTDPRL